MTFVDAGKRQATARIGERESYGATIRISWAANVISGFRTRRRRNRNTVIVAVYNFAAFAAEMW